jgi:hypothetical protein
MLYDTPLMVESTLPPLVVLERIRRMVASRQMINTPRFRLYQALGWRFKEDGERLTLALDYGSATDAYGARFEGRLEAYGAGSRIAGRVVLSRLSRAILSVWFAFVIVGTISALREGGQSALTILIIAAVMITGGLFIAQYSVRSTRTLVEAGLRGATRDH